MTWQKSAEAPAVTAGAAAAGGAGAVGKLTPCWASTCVNWGQVFQLYH